MGKKSSKSSSSSCPKKISKQEKKPQLNNLMKILRPKVYITDTSNFKNLVQELTGNGKYPAVETSPQPLPPPPPPTFVPLSPPTSELPFVETYQDFHHHHHNLVYQESMSSSIDASSPELRLPAAAVNREMEEREKMEIYKGLEAMLMMEMDSDSCDYDDACYDQMFQQDQVCVYDYDLSNFV